MMVQVAAVSGDVRRCLELLRRAAEITEANTKQAAAPATTASNHTQASGLLLSQKNHSFLQAPVQDMDIHAVWHERACDDAEHATATV